MNIKNKYDPLPGGEDESFSDMLSPSRTSNIYTTSRNFNVASCPTVNEGLEPDYDESILTEENNLLASQVEQSACTSKSTEKTKAKVIINAPSSVKDRPVNLKLINRRPTGFIRLTSEELSRDSSLYRGTTSKSNQKSVEEQLGTVTIRVPAKINKPANLKIVHRRPTGFIRTPLEIDSSFNQQTSEDDEDDETSNLNSIEEIPGNIIACLHGTDNKNNQFNDCVCIDCPNYTKFQGHNNNQVKDHQEFCRKRGANGDDESCIEERENTSETNDESDPDNSEPEFSNKERSSNQSDNDSNEYQGLYSSDINYDHRREVNLIKMPDGARDENCDNDSGSTPSNESDEKISEEYARVESEEDGSRISPISDEFSNNSRISSTSDESSDESSQDRSELYKKSLTVLTSDKGEDTVSGTSHTSGHFAKIDSQEIESEDAHQSPPECLDQKSKIKWDIAASRLELNQEQAIPRGLSQITTDPTGSTNDKNKDEDSGSIHTSEDSSDESSELASVKSESSTISTGVPSLDIKGIFQDPIYLGGSNESVGRTNDSSSGSSLILEESSEKPKIKRQLEPSTIDNISEKADSSKEHAKDRKAVTLVEDEKVAALIENKPKNMKILKRSPTGFIRTVQEYYIERRKKLKGPARFAFQCDSFIIRDYWKKSKPAIKSIPVGGPPPPLPKRLKRK